MVKRTELIKNLKNIILIGEYPLVKARVAKGKPSPQKMATINNRILKSCSLFFMTSP
jgi:hypothetical protein